METYLFNFKKRTNSTKQPVLSSGTRIDGNMKNGFDVNNPIIEYSFPSNAVPTYNYLYITDVSRYYFVTWSWVEGFWIANCRLDSMASFKIEISNCNAFIERCADSTNISMVDTMVSVKDEFERIDTIGTRILDPDNYMYVITVLGKGSTSTPYLITPDNYNTLTSKLFSSASYDKFTQYVADKLVQVVASASDCLLSCRAIPFSVSGTPSNIWLGDYDSGVSGVAIDPSTVVSTHADIEVAQYYDTTDFRHYEPYSNYNLTIPSVGTVPIPSTITHGLLRADFKVNWDGTGTCELKSAVGETMYATYPVDFGIDIPIGKYVNALSPTRLAGTVGGIVNLFNTGSVTGILSGANAYTSGGGCGSGFSGLNNGYLESTCIAHHTTSIDRTVVGKPYMEVGLISSFGGYIKTNNASVSTGYDDINNEINSIMNGGFYYE